VDQEKHSEEDYSSGRAKDQVRKIENQPQPAKRGPYRTEATIPLDLKQQLHLAIQNQSANRTLGRSAHRTPDSIINMDFASFVSCSTITRG